MTLSRDEISVIIPNYNRATLIGDTIENMLGQSLPPKEVIVVDDGSTDNSVPVITGFGSRVTLIRQENKGPGSARNAGLAVASGEFIQFMDSDDLVSRNKLETQIAAIHKSGADLVYGPWVRTMISGKNMEFIGPVMQTGPLPDWKSMLEWQMGSWSLVFQNCLLRRRIIDVAGKFREDLMPSEDSEYLVRVLMAGARYCHTSDCLTFYREHDLAQITSSGTTKQRRAEDWTLYLECVGNEVLPLINGFHWTTKMEIALNLYRHQRYCRKNRWKDIRYDEPFNQLLCSIPLVAIWLCDLFDRFHKKLYGIKGATPSSQGMVCRPVGDGERTLAKELGYIVA